MGDLIGRRVDTSTEGSDGRFRERTVAWKDGGTYFTLEAQAPEAQAGLAARELEVSRADVEWRADLPADERRWLVLDADQVLGLDLHLAWDAPRDEPDTDAGAGDLPPGDAALIADRDAARAAHDFTRADALRSQLAEHGIEVVDGPDGSTWRRR